MKLIHGDEHNLVPNLIEDIFGTMLKFLQWRTIEDTKIENNLFIIAHNLFQYVTVKLSTPTHFLLEISRIMSVYHYPDSTRRYAEPQESTKKLEK